MATEMTKAGPAIRAQDQARIKELEAEVETYLRSLEEAAYTADALTARIKRLEGGVENALRGAIRVAKAADEAEAKLAEQGAKTQEPPTPDAIPAPVLDDPFEGDEWESAVVAQAKAQERERIEQAIARIDYSGGGWLIDDLINAVYEAITQPKGGNDG